MKLTHLTIAAALLCPLPAPAQIINNDVPVQSGNDVVAQNTAAPEQENPSIASALADPHADLADLGMAQPGSSLDVPR